MWATPITIDIFILNELVNASLFVASCQIWNEAELKKNEILKFFSFFEEVFMVFPDLWLLTVSKTFFSH